MAMNLKLKGMPYQAFYHGLLLARRSDGRLYQSRAGTILYGLFLAFLLRCNLLMWSSEKIEGVAPYPQLIYRLQASAAQVGW